MADEEPTPEEPKEPAEPAKGEPKDDGEDGLPDTVKTVLAKERKAARDAERARKAAEARVKEFEDRDKTEQEKVAERLAAAEQRASDAETRLLRAEVAAEKGLTPAQAKRLTGSTREDLEADADELLELFGANGKPPVSGKPKERLRGGGDPDKEPIELDPAKLAAQIPRDAY